MSVRKISIQVSRYCFPSGQHSSMAGFLRADMKKETLTKKRGQYNFISIEFHIYSSNAAIGIMKMFYFSRDITL